MAKPRKPKPESTDAAPADIDAFTTTLDLLQRVRAGDREALEGLFVHFRRPLELYLHAQLPLVVRSVQDTQDAVQEVMMRMLKTLPNYKYRGVGSLWGYIRMIARNYVLEQVRERKHWGAAKGQTGDAPAPETPAKQASPFTHAEARERFELYEHALSRIPERTRRALLMKLELKLEFADIARECGFSSADAARMAVARAVRQMAQALGEGAEPE
ncbi:MAG: sigma-70 family RNA polymerase sigma factor [Planctomycetes bacterium]|nr:sigma-70 family RNA polymerase sigma factor [Planctomycetota bacterium]